MQGPAPGGAAKHLRVALVLIIGCASTLTDGELGTPRVTGFVRGASPDVQVLAPVGDRAGNIYVLTGKRDFPEVSVFVGRAGGGFSSGCSITKGDRFGPHGWVGSSIASFGVSATGRDLTRQARQWYWSGAALVSVSSFGDCHQVLDKDPATGTDLLFDAVLPWVNDTPDKTTAVALVRAPGETLPFTVVLDLNSNIYTVPRAFEPASATSFVVHGVGASLTARQGWVLASFDQGDSTRTEARFYDEGGSLTARSPIAKVDPAIPEFGIRGYLQGSDAGLVAGLTTDKRLVVFDRSSGRMLAVDGMEPVGVHVWEGSLYLVGTSDNRPVISQIRDDGKLTAPTPWESSVRIASKLGRALAVTDDRSPPRRTTTFSPARSTGAFPLLTEHSSFRYADGETLVTIGGPTIGEGDSTFTLVAVAPVGVSYP